MAAYSSPTVFLFTFRLLSVLRLAEGDVSSVRSFVYIV